MGYPRERAPELLRAWADHLRDAPDELGSGFAFITAPPEEFVPEEVRGQPVCGVVVLYAGPVEEGQAVVQGLRDALGPPAMDLAMPMPYLVVQQLLDAREPARPAAVLEVGHDPGDDRRCGRDARGARDQDPVGHHRDRARGQGRRDPARAGGLDGPDRPEARLRLLRHRPVGGRRRGRGPHALGAGAGRRRWSRTPARTSRSTS